MAKLIEEKNCYYCSGHTLLTAFDNIRDHLGVSKELWRFLRCDNCHALILSPHPDSASLTAFYPAQYSFTVSKKAESIGRRIIAKLEYWIFYRWLHRSQALSILRLFGRRDGYGLKLLDIGCGNGMLLRESRDLGFSAIGCDQRQEAIEYLQKVLKIPGIVSSEDIAAHFPPESFDVITAFHLVEHIINPYESIMQWRNLLKPGGALVIGVPMADSIQGRIFGKHWSGICEAPRHVSVPSRQALEKLLERAGFENITISSDSVLFSAIAMAHTFFPCALHAAIPNTDALIPRLRSRICRGVGLILTYLVLPMAFIENKILKRPGASIAIAFKPVK